MTIGIESRPRRTVGEIAAGTAGQRDDSHPERFHCHGLVNGLVDVRVPDAAEPVRRHRRRVLHPA